VTWLEIDNIQYNVRRVMFRVAMRDGARKGSKFFAATIKAWAALKFDSEKPNELPRGYSKLFLLAKPAVIDVVSDCKVLRPRAWA
jgi:hypothetical protein